MRKFKDHAYLGWNQESNVNRLVGNIKATATALASLDETLLKAALISELGDLLARPEKKEKKNA